MQPSTYVPSFYFYKLAQAISSPYTSLTAYQGGAIDENGNLLKAESSIDAFEYLVIKLKKIFEQLPYGTTKAKLANYMSTLQLFGEEIEKFKITQEQFHCLVEGIVTQNTNGELSYLELLEDMAVGAGGGAAGSLGTPAQAINQGGIAGFDPKMGMPLMRRKKPNYFSNSDIFEVDPEEFVQYKAAKKWTDVPDSETKKYLQRFQRRNKSAKVAVKSLNPLNGEHELHWITYPAKNFMEDVDKSLFDYLFENEDMSQGRANLNKIAKAQYSAVGNFLTNHVKNLHQLNDDDDIVVHLKGQDPASVKFKDFQNHLNSSINKVHGSDQKDKSNAVFTFTAKQKSFKATVPHVSTHGIPDLTIEDSHVSDSPIKIDTKSARGRWEDKSGKFQDNNKKPRQIPTSEFDTGKPDKNSFVVIHDQDGNVKYVDHSHMPNVKKLLSKAYVKSGSKKRPGKFAMIGEISARLAKEGIKKAFKRNLPFYQEDKTDVGRNVVLQASAKENFAEKLAQLTNTKFGENDLYTSLFKKKQ